MFNKEPKQFTNMVLGPPYAESPFPIFILQKQFTNKFIHFSIPAFLPDDYRDICTSQQHSDLQ